MNSHRIVRSRQPAKFFVEKLERLVIFTARTVWMGLMITGLRHLARSLNKNRFKRVMFQNCQFPFCRFHLFARLNYTIPTPPKVWFVAGKWWPKNFVAEPTQAVSLRHNRHPCWKTAPYHWLQRKNKGTDASKKLSDLNSGYVRQPDEIFDQVLYCFWRLISGFQ